MRFLGTLLGGLSSSELEASDRAEESGWVGWLETGRLLWDWWCDEEEA